MARFRRPVIMALAAALLAGGLACAPFATAQDGDTGQPDSKIGSREQKTMDVDWDALRRELPRPAPGPEPAAPMIAGVPQVKLSESRLPILLPRDESMQERMRLFAEENYYVASLRDEEHSVQITGTRLAQGPLQSEGASGRMRQMSDEEGYVYQRTEYGCELSFTRYNVSYNISVECREPKSDPRCTGKDYVMQLAEALTYVGGMPDDGGD